MEMDEKVDVETVCEQESTVVDVESITKKSDNNKKKKTSPLLLVFMALITILIIALSLYLYTRFRQPQILPPDDPNMILVFLAVDSHGNQLFDSKNQPVYVDQQGQQLFLDSQGNVLQDVSIGTFMRENKWIVGGAIAVVLAIVVAVIVVVVLLIKRNQELAELTQQQEYMAAAGRRRRPPPPPREWRQVPLFGDTPMDTPGGFAWWTMMAVVFLSALVVAVKRAVDPKQPHRTLYFILTVSLVYPVYRLFCMVTEAAMCGLHHLRVRLRDSGSVPIRIVHTVLSVLLLPVLLVYMMVALVAAAGVGIASAVGKKDDKSRVEVSVEMFFVSVKGIGMVGSLESLQESVREGEAAFKELLSS